MLLNELQTLMDCLYVSDLRARFAQLDEEQKARVLAIPDEAYTLYDWNNALEYVMGVKSQAASVTEAKQLIITK